MSCPVHHTRTGVDPYSRVNAAETLYAAFPALMYLDPSLGGPLLEPLFRLQVSYNDIRYAASDLGVSGINMNVGVYDI